MRHPMFLLSGIPASGKSHFGAWLEAHQGFLHFDVEKDGRLNQTGLLPLWERCLRHREALLFVHAIEQLNRPVIVNWGFPTAFLPVVEALKEAGFLVCWFDADKHAAEEAFVRRGDVPLAAFRRQMRDIARDWARIDPVFRPHIIRTLQPDGARMAPSEIYQHVLAFHQEAARASIQR